MMKQLTSTALVSLALTGFCFAQQGTDNKRATAPKPPSRIEQSPPPEEDTQTVVFVSGTPMRDNLPHLSLPPEEGAWVIQIVKRGGVRGRVESALLINSRGDLAADESASSRRAKLSPTLLRTLHRRVASSRLAGSDNNAFLSFCSDCPVMTLTLHRRESGGFANTSTVSWDVTTASRELRGDVAKIYSDALSLKRRTLAGQKK